MRNIVPSAIEELLSFHPGNCHACHELHEQLKAALMDYLLLSTSMYGQEFAEIRSRSTAKHLNDALMEFRSHREDTHFLDYFDLSWLDMPMRDAS